MPSGRLPRPTYLKVLEGNPGKRPINAAEPVPPGDLVEPPSHLAPEVRRLWIDTLRDVPEGLLRRLDGPAYESWCIETMRYREADREVRKLGLLIKGPDGRPMRNPYLAIARDAWKAAARQAAELGFTPSSRSRVKVENKKPDKASPFAKLKSLTLGDAD